jgi:cytosine permease
MTEQRLGSEQPSPAGQEDASWVETAVADYTESVVPQSARRSNFRMLLTFGSMQLVFGAVLVGYNARFQGMTLGRLAEAMAVAAVSMTVYCIGSANVGAVVGQTQLPAASSGRWAALLSRCCWSSTAWVFTCSRSCS